ncbi:TadE/TadG family type IV pilus assembly protein [Paraburkholderia kururiensis]|jgi:Flp pilus assembly protein TadG|uniref:TadE family protein n=1 Tax=Paraburkholderia kururiensis TaxID=984307 RepID=A0ABZ0WSL0_9BURK|nr:TadE family protein [Paraburkholderia kururiensis]WQD80362.1 TadE family protein [Paraburkholderia kururiensis]
MNSLRTLRPVKLSARYIKASPDCISRHTRRRERGSTAVEFALLFPVFFAIAYAVVSYSLVFVAQQSLTLASEEGARAALRYQKAANMSAALAARTSAACLAATNAASWLGSTALTCSPQAQNCSYDSTMTCVQVQLSYDYKNHPLVPSLPLVDFKIPDAIVTQSTVQLNPENIL